MKLLVSLLLAGFLALDAAPPAVVFVMQDARYTGAEKEIQTTRITVQGTNLKFERLADDGTVLGTDLIFRGDLDQMWIIDNEARTVRVMDRAGIDAVAGELDAAMKEVNKELEGLPADQRALVEEMMKKRMPTQTGAAAPAAPELKGPTDAAVVAGYPCRKYEVYEGDVLTEEVWVTNWIRLKEGKVARDALLAMGQFYQGMMAAIQQHMPMGMGAGLAQNPFQAIDQYGGYPVWTVHYEAGKRTRESKLHAVETVADAQFDTPEGYAVQSMAGDR